METVNKKIELISKLKSEIFAIEESIENKNTILLYEEVLNLLNGVGNVIKGDYYAPNRINSNIPGVKNLRFAKYERNLILIKITSPKGMLLPMELTIEKVLYKFDIIHSKNFNNNVDY